MPLRVGAIYYASTGDGSVCRITGITSRSIRYRQLNQPGSEHRMLIAEFEANWVAGPRVPPATNTHPDPVGTLLAPGSVWRPLRSFPEVVENNPTVFRHGASERTERVVVHGQRGHGVYFVTTNTRELRATVWGVLEGLAQPTQFDRPTVEAFLRQHTRMYEEEIDPAVDTLQRVADTVERHIGKKKRSRKKTASRRRTNYAEEGGPVLGPNPLGDNPMTTDSWTDEERAEAEEMLDWDTAETTPIIGQDKPMNETPKKKSRVKKPVKKKKTPKRRKTLWERLDEPIV